MGDTIGIEDIGRMIRSAADLIRANRDELSKLDSAIGDGDHGTTIARAMTIAEKHIEESEKEELKGLLKDVGWGVMGVDGGATGPLLGSFLMGTQDPMVTLLITLVIIAKVILIGCFVGKLQQLIVLLVTQEMI